MKHKVTARHDALVLSENDRAVRFGHNPPMRSYFGACLALFLSVGCSTASPTTTGVFVVPASLDTLAEDHFFDQPWPSDLRKDADGTLHLKGFPNPRQLANIAEYIDAMKGRLDGFSPGAAGCVRFTGPLDPTSLPATPGDAMQNDASVQLIDIDPSSPEHGKRRPITLLWREAAGVYWAPNSLAFMPTIGFPLRTRTRYAFVVKTTVRAKDGSAIGPSADLKSVLAGDASGALGPASFALKPALDDLENIGIARDDIAQVAVFTTNDPTAELFALRDHLRANVPAPQANPAKWKLNTSKLSYDEYTGEYGPSPNYQHGKIPFEHYGDGGDFAFDGGKPTVADTFDLRFSLTVPKESDCPMPANGYPVVMYAHGTGGDYRSYLKDGTALALVGQCIASMGVDQIFHGTRPGAPADGNESTIELLFFNFQNIIAARTNARQSALDEVQRARLFTETKMTIPGSLAKSGKDVRFDPTNVTFFGHSQGGLNGPLFLASDDQARGGVLSGSGALLSIALLEKTKPEPSIAGIVKSIFLGLKTDEQDEVSYHHPVIALTQTMIDLVDPYYYARHAVSEPRAGFKPKSILMTEGINPDGTGDSYAPPHGIEAHALSMGLPLQLPGTHPLLEAAYGGPAGVTVPADGLSGNLGGGLASGVLAQWAVPDGSDGHFVVFDVPAAQKQAATFCKNLGADPKGRVPAP